MLLGSRESSTVTLFSDPVNNTVYEKIFENQVNNDSYNSDAAIARQRLTKNVLFDRMMTQIQDLHVDKSFYVTRILAKNVSLLPISIWH